MAMAAGARMSCGSGRDEVYIVAVPLRASKGPAKLLFSTAYSLNFWDFHHFMLIINPSSPPHPHQAVVYDFQPHDPENIWVALAALSGRKVPGVILVRKVGKVPKRKCWFVGHAKKNAIDAALAFNSNWDTQLTVGHHDCRNYTQALAEYLTGKTTVLEELRERSTSYN